MNRRRAWPDGSRRAERPMTLLFENDTGAIGTIVIHDVTIDGRHV